MNKNSNVCGELSILISSHNRLPLLTRTLHSIQRFPPPCPFEIVIADDGSTDDILGLLRNFTLFRWTLIRCDRVIFAETTGVTPFFNCPAWTNNVAARYASQESQVFALQGNEVIVTEGTYENLLREFSENSLLFSTTYDIPLHLLNKLTKDGDNIDKNFIENCTPWPLQSEYYRSDVTNYCSICPRSLWYNIGGYDERYLGGIGAEDSDFVRRSRVLPHMNISVCNEAISLHQSHGGKTRYYQPRPNVISQSLFEEGCAINRARYNEWDGRPQNSQRWPWGEVGVVEVIRN